MSTDSASASAASARVADILVENHLLSVATLREDGWPQVTTANDLADSLAFYFLVARCSQKLANVMRDWPRLISLIDYSVPPGTRQLLSVDASYRLELVPSPPAS